MDYTDYNFHRLENLLSNVSFHDQVNQNLTGYNFMDANELKIDVRW